MFFLSLTSSLFMFSFRDLVPNLRRQVIGNIARTFQLKQVEAETLYLDMKLCMRRRDLVSPFASSAYLLIGSLLFSYHIEGGGLKNIYTLS